MNISDRRYFIDRARHAWRRYLLREEIERTYLDVGGRFDKTAFTEALRPYWDPFAGAGAAKYLNIEIWLREAIFRYLLCAEGLERSGRIVDLGSGAGYFLWVCREFGHDILGIDIAGEPIYDACVHLLDIPRVEFQIEPHRPMCDTGGELAMIGAFMSCFDRYEDGRTWGTAPWEFFLSDARERLRTGGRLTIKFNADVRTGELYSPGVKRLFASRPDYRCRILMDYVLLTAR